ncbi:protein-tyrosine phosphatase-like protein [Mycena belliarum]|uniref:protein-tyrosine-phosphatase n=1 Tax=Mycena belliarum TaxID=1033014 RepID=A0AAD6U3Y1_9AGAR|nr:protein-tyrosine phosphatase-like protein [Mycena belliae]
MDLPVASSTNKGYLRLSRGGGDAESCNAIIAGRLYLGNLSAAECPQLSSRLGITHILSVCPDYLAPAANVQHLTLPMVDDEHYDILQHLPNACHFIQDALDGGGRVLVHCVMGISRSAAVVCAYLMFSRQSSAAQAIQFVRTRRPQSRPNHNFIRQLQVFGEFNYEISPATPAYVAWRTRQDFDEANSLLVIYGMAVTDRLFLSLDFPANPSHATALLDHLAITHIVSITPDNVCSVGLAFAARVHKHFAVSNTAKEALLVALPPLCHFVRSALDAPAARVLLHCLDETRGGLAICAYLMSSRRIGPSAALAALHARVPLFEESATLRRELELFEKCAYAPARTHPLVRAWVAPREVAAGYVCVGGVGAGIAPKAKALQAGMCPLLGVSVES